jgi:sulfur-carrier protein
MALKLVFLGKLAELAGVPESEFICTSGEIDWADLLAWLEDWGSPELAEAVRGEKVKLALNGQIVPDKTMLDARDGDEVAMLPPVSGG